MFVIMIMLTIVCADLLKLSFTEIKAKLRQNSPYPNKNKLKPVQTIIIKLIVN